MPFSSNSVVNNIKAWRRWVVLDSAGSRRLAENAELELLLGQYISNWGPIPWRSILASANPSQNLQLGHMLLCIGAAENNVQVIHKKLRTANLEHRPSIAEFNISWLAEEVEHGRALKHLARMLGADYDPPTRRDGASLRNVIAWPALALARPLGPYLEAAYMTVGTAAEYFTLTAYRECALLFDDPYVQELLRTIAAQEARHMHFYRNAAIILLEREGAAHFTSYLMGKLWQPPGIEPFGTDMWLDIMRPLLERQHFLRRMLKLDSIIQQLPGQQAIHPMSRFLARHGYVPDG